MKKRFLSLALVLAMCLSLFLPPSALAASDDFEIDEDGVLTKYTGPGGDVTIPDGATEIGYVAFYECSSLTSITIPDSVTSIGDWAFGYCSSLTSITIPDSVTSIGDGAFYDCDSLTSVTIPDSVTRINGGAFYDCDSLTNVKISSSVTRIGDDTFFSCENLTSVIIPTSVTSIGNRTFQYCRSLTSVTIPSSVTSIGYCAFSSCDSLTSVKIPDSVTSIEDFTFEGCSSLTSITIPDSVTSIDGYAFCRCSNLTSITIPDSITKIGRNAFDECSSLTDVYYGGNEERWAKVEIGDGNVPLETVTIHYTDTSVNPGLGGDTPALPQPSGETSGKCGDYLTWELKDGTLTIDGLVGPMYDFDDQTPCPWQAYSESGSIHKVVIESDYALKIGDNAFRNCIGLTEVKLKDGLRTIGTGAFENCNNLAKVEYTRPSSGTKWEEIDILSGNEPLTNSYIGETYVTTLSPPFIGSDKDVGPRIFYTPRLSLAASDMFQGDSGSIYAYLSQTNAGQITDTIKWHSDNPSVISFDSKETADAQGQFDIRDTDNYIYGVADRSILAKGTGTATITCRLSNGQEEKINITVYSKKEKKYQELLEQFVEQYDKYMEYLEKTTKCEPTEKDEKTFDQVVEEAMKSGGESLGFVVTSNVLIGDDKVYPYRALIRMLQETTYNQLDISGVKVTKDRIKVDKKIVNAVLDSVSHTDYTYNDPDGTKVVIDCGGFSGQNTGGMQVYLDSKSARYVPVAFAPTREQITKVIDKYILDLVALEGSCIEYAKEQIADDFLNVIGAKSLKEISEEFAKKKATEAVKRLVDFFQKRGFGKAVEVLNSGYNFYNKVKDWKNLDVSKIPEIVSEWDKFKFEDLGDPKPEDNGAKALLKGLTAIKTKIVNRMDEMSAEEKRGWTDALTRGGLGFGYHCPVDVLVFDMDGNQIGFIGDKSGEQSNVDYLTLSRDGDAKFVYSAGHLVTTQVIGTAPGTVSCVFEQLDENGNIVKREQYNDIPIQKSDVISSSVSSDENNLMRVAKNDARLYVDQSTSGGQSMIPVSPNTQSSVSSPGITFKPASTPTATPRPTPTPTYGSINTPRPTATPRPHATPAPRPNPSGSGSFAESSPQPVPNNLFSDVPNNAWYAGAVNYVVKNQIMTGVGNDSFYPDLSITRAEIVQTFYNLAGRPSTNIRTAGFEDVSSNSWYFEAVNWASLEDLVLGYGNGCFGPGDRVTREQFVTILYRYEEARISYPGYSPKGEDMVDWNQVSNYANTPIKWALGNNIVQGKEGKRIDPLGTVTRAEIATMMMRYHQKFIA